MKKIVCYALSLITTISLTAAPGSKIVQSFNETFPNARNVKWNDDKLGFFVSFNQGEYFEKVLYSQSGDFVCSWKYSDGKELPVNITIALNKKYGEHTILGVTEFASHDNTTYEIKISKGNIWYCIKALGNGSILKEEKFVTDNNE